ncbi:MAG TPA: hypothetical protein V6D19_05530 [Stenomitos sp.]
MLPTNTPTTGLVGLDAFSKFLSIAFAEGEQIWLKEGRTRFFTGSVLHSGLFALTEKKAPDYDKPIDAWFDGFEYLYNRSIGASTEGVFFIPGKPTIKPRGEYVTESDLVSMEIDEGTADQQWQIIREFYEISGLSPSIILTSGGKSFHVHNKLSHKLPIADRTYIARLYCVALGGDYMVTNPHQPMRCPGFFRKEKNNHQVLVHADETATFTPDEWIAGLRLVFAAKGLEFPESISDEQFRLYKGIEGTLTPEIWSKQVLHPPIPTYSLPSSSNRDTERSGYKYDGAIVPLENFLTRNDQDLLANGKSEGGRNIAGIALALNLFATAKRLDFLGIKYSGYPDIMFEEYCNRCSPPLSGYECQSILRSVEHKPSATPTLPDEILQSRASWHEYQERRGRFTTNFGSQTKRRVEAGEISREEFEKLFGSTVASVLDEETSGSTTTAAKPTPNYWGYLKKNLKGMAERALDFARSLDSKWGELHDELPEMGSSDIAPPSFNRKHSSTIYYTQGQRLEFWHDFIKSGARYIFDRSTMGLGKSYDAGLLEPESLGVDKLIYVAAEHRNITTPTLESWIDLVPRHNGLVRDEHGKLRRRTDVTQAWVEKPNCARTGLLALLRDRNIEAADAASTICQSCPHFEGCRNGSGDYTYLYDRGQTLQKSRFRCHPASLPPLDQFDYSADPEKMRKHKKPRVDAQGNQVYESPVRGTGLVWEEWSQILTDSKTIKANLADIHQLCGYLMQVNPELANRIQPITSALASLMNPANQGKYGHGHFMIVKKLEIALGMPKSEWPSLFSDLIIELDRWTNPSVTGAIDQLFQIGDEIDGMDVRDLPKSVRDRLGKSEAELIAEATATILKQWLPEFLGVISGMDSGCCNINFDQLTITICDKHLVHIAKAAAFNIFLDATEMPENLAAILGIEVGDIVTIAQEVQPSDNHEIIQITGMGRLGSGRGNEQSRRLSEVLKALAKDHPDLAIVDWKKFIDPEFGKELGCNQYAWWRDSRGTNDIYNNGCTAIALAGIPTKPLEQYRAQFACRYGYVPDSSEEEVTRWVTTAAGYLPFTDSESSDPKFRQFIYDDIQSTIEQGMGRIRATRRPDERLTFYLIGDFAHRFPISWHVQACNITKEAASKTESLEMAILETIQAMQEEQHAHKNKPANITLTSIAERCGKSLSHLSNFIRKNLGWKSSDTFIDALQTLLFNSNSKTKYHLSTNPLHPDQPSHLTPDDKFLIDHYIPLAYEKIKDLEHLVPQILQDIFDHAAEYGRQCLPRILNALPAQIRQDILQFFFSLLPQDELEELIT